MFKFSVPWPHASLSPNARANRWAFARAKKAYRTGCAWEAVAGGVRKIDVDRVAVKITFCPPNANRRDDDNTIASFKSGRDGIADALGVDDGNWSVTYAHGAPVKFGRVLIEIEATP